MMSFGGVMLKGKLGYDDSLDVVGIHGLGGIWGALATGLFASTAINSGAADGLFHGNPGQLWTQFVSVVATMAFSYSRLLYPQPIVALFMLTAIIFLLYYRVNRESRILFCFAFFYALTVLSFNAFVVTAPFFLF